MRFYLKYLSSQYTPVKPSRTVACKDTGYLIGHFSEVIDCKYLWFTAYISRDTIDCPCQTFKADNNCSHIQGIISYLRGRI